MKICVYGASSAKIDKSYIDAGEELGRLMVKRGHSLVFGGGDDGLELVELSVVHGVDLV